MTAMYSFIAEEKANPESVWSAAEMCRVLEVSRQGFYDWEQRPPSQRQVTDRLLAVEIEAIWECSARSYGSPSRPGRRFGHLRSADPMYG